MIEYIIDLTDSQIKKIRSTFKKHKLVKILLSYKQINGEGKHKILLSETQKKRSDTSIRLKKGLVLELNHEQLRINHSGGSLPLIFAGLGALGALIGGGAAVANTVTEAKHEESEEDEIKRHNTEMENIVKNAKSFFTGSGLKTKNVIKIDLTDYQIKKIRSAFKKHKPARIRLAYEQIIGKGKHKILVSETQKHSFDRSIKSKKGFVLELDHEQMKVNHSGGFLQFIIPIATALGAPIGGGTAIANSVTDGKHKKVEEEELKRHNQKMERIAQKAKIMC